MKTLEDYKNLYSQLEKLLDEFGTRTILDYQGYFILKLE